MAKLFIRVNLGAGRLVGPGKIRLLELIGELGSISAAGRAMEMSYRRAWLLIDDLNRSFREPAVGTQHGGKSGGGAALTPFGRDLIRRYRCMEAAAHAALAGDLAALDAAAAEPPPEADAAAGPPIPEPSTKA